jgi:hypothetical protein
MLLNYCYKGSKYLGGYAALALRASTAGGYCVVGRFDGHQRRDMLPGHRSYVRRQVRRVGESINDR